MNKEIMVYDIMVNKIMVLSFSRFLSLINEIYFCLYFGKGNRRGYYNKYDKDLGDRYWMQNERPNDHNYYRSNEIIDRRRPIDNPYPVTVRFFSTIFSAGK